MSKMDRRLLLLVVSTSTVALLAIALLAGAFITLKLGGWVCGGLIGLPCPGGYDCEYGNKDVTDAFGVCVPTTDELPPQNQSYNKTCELGREYEISSSSDLNCTCPAGYRFDFSIIGYSHRGDVESPILGGECVPEE